jgi:hypothetical protein
MVALDHIRIRRRRALRLTAATLTSKVLRRIPRSCTIRTTRSTASCTLPALLRRILIRNTRLLTRKLAPTRLILGHRTIIHASLSLRPGMADDIVRCSLTSAFLVRNRPVAVIAIVGVRVLQDNVPGVQEAGQEAQAAERDVDEGVGGAKTSLYPDWWCVSQCWCRVGVQTRRCGCLGGYLPPMGGKRTLRSIRKQSAPHMVALLRS